ncbi:MAG TPA: rhodanese-like domain-containing protein [Gammaproteobacteria bacterium]
MFGFNVKEIDVAELQQLLSEERENIHLIDVRSPAEIAQGAIPGAEPLPLHLLPLQLDRIPADKKVVLYCRSGARSAQACAFVEAQGKSNVYNLRGGIIAWAQHGLAIA